MTATPGAAPSPTETDTARMRQALALAERGRGTTHPNPMVGCVLVQGGTVVGEGWHARVGEAHAEVLALATAGDRARGATAYVTLEPCSHHGRTPPCADALIAAGVARVVMATRDPDPRVAGTGLARLRAAGIDVDEGVLREEAEALNAAYLVHRREGRPWVRYKTAMTLDGKIATRTGRSRWITGPDARALVHVWRHQADAVAVGVSTLLQDDPALTTRLAGDAAPGRTPRKVVFDGVARTPVTARAFEPGPDGAPARVTVVVGPEAPPARVAALEERGAQVVRAPARQGRPDVVAALRALAADGVVELLLEGGGTLAWSFLEAGAIDRVAWFVAPKLIGGRGASPLAGLGVAGMDEAVALQAWDVRRLGEDLLVEGDVAARPLRASRPEEDR
ncbi:MAG: bifunctional diaminohydroxyphosphoribosylaminopyrimidine deaminase/5-amino-6-(5-phosphoribosylamino)uracil reductase RibD [Trueperaceae bacterium]|nr:bifunctional diaminohydroxyphosphoribosylaminopyrimidine deaminase/5-amino-6-(5-phosphoribosylamino)uracil reductase RibD [Trueperaceae bacterium]